MRPGVPKVLLKLPVTFSTYDVGADRYGQLQQHLWYTRPHVERYGRPRQLHTQRRGRECLWHERRHIRANGRRAVEVPGVPGQFEDNIVRERFNDLIRKTYDGRAGRTFWEWTQDPFV